MAATRLAQACIGPLKANGADIVCWDGDLTGFGVRVRKSGRKNNVLQTRVRGKLRRFTIGQRGRITPTRQRSRREGQQLCREPLRAYDPDEEHTPCQS